MIEQSKYTAACYCRLSRDDEQDGTSISIETQKKVLEATAKPMAIPYMIFIVTMDLRGLILTDRALSV